MQSWLSVNLSLFFVHKKGVGLYLILDGRENTFISFLSIVYYVELIFTFFFNILFFINKLQNSTEDV